MHLALLGYYGFENQGDEAILAALLEGIAREDPSVRVTVLSHDPGATSRVHGVESVERRIPNLRRLMTRADALVFGGGSLLQDVTSQKSLLFYLTCMGMSLPRPVAWVAQGIGPLTRPWGRRAVAAAAQRLRYLSVRDTISRDLLVACGVDPARIRVTVDPVFGFEPVPKAPPEKAPCLGVAPRPFGDGRWVEPFTRSLAELSRQGARIELVCMRPPEDLPLCRKIAGDLGDVPVILGTIPVLRQRVASFTAMIGVRLHALIFAAVEGVPWVGVRYDPKIDGLRDRLGAGAVVGESELGPEQLVPVVKRSQLERDRMLRRSAELRVLAREEIRALLAAVGRP